MSISSSSVPRSILRPRAPESCNTLRLFEGHRGCGEVTAATASSGRPSGRSKTWVCTATRFSDPRTIGRSWTSLRCWFTHDRAAAFMSEAFEGRPTALLKEARRGSMRVENTQYFQFCSRLFAHFRHRVGVIIFWRWKYLHGHPLNVLFKVALHHPLTGTANESN